MPGSFDNQNDARHQTIMDVAPAAQATSSSVRNALRCMPDMQTQQEAMSPGSCGIDPLMDLFDRVNTDKGHESTGLDRSELKNYLESVGVTGVLFAGTIRNKTAKALIKQLDTDGDKKISAVEVQAMAAAVLPDKVFDSDGRVDTDLLDKYFRDTDSNANQRIEQPELQAAILGMMPEGTKSADTKAWVGSLVGVDTLDSLDKDGSISREEFAILAARAEKSKSGGGDQ